MNFLYKRQRDCKILVTRFLVIGMIQNNDTRDKIGLSIGRSNNYPMRKQSGR